MKCIKCDKCGIHETESPEFMKRIFVHFPGENRVCDLCGKCFDEFCAWSEFMSKVSYACDDRGLRRL